MIGFIIVVMHWQTGMVQIKGREMLLFYFSKNLVEKVAEKVHKICLHFKKNHCVFLHIQLHIVLLLMNQGEIRMNALIDIK